MFPLGPEWQAARAKAAGEGSPPWRGMLGEQMGQEDGSRLGRGLCHHLLHHPHPHFGFRAEPGFENSNHRLFGY